MANLVNLWAEAGADVIGDDAQPTLTLRNTSTGPGLKVEGLVTASGASIADATAFATAAGSPGFNVTNSVVGSQTVGLLKITGASRASGAVIEFANKAFISITSTVLTSVANTDYAVVVQVGLETRYIPLFKSAAIVGMAAVD